jgi:hypothetical protein
MYATGKRIPSENVVSPNSGTIERPLPPSVPDQTDTQTGAISRLFAGLFGKPNPVSYGQSAQVEPPPRKGFYHYVEGDQFSAGSPSFIYEPTTELTPVYPFWGRAFLRTPNTFLPYQPAQIMSEQTVMLGGLGGLQAGQFVLQGLEETPGA